MIKSITVYNRFNIDLIAANLKEIPYKHWNLISISCPDTSITKNSLVNEKTKASLESQGCHRILELQFDDARDDQVEEFLKQGISVTLFTKDQANKIIEFVKEIQGEVAISDLVIHCDAGISRSGAIAEFVSFLYGIPFKDPYTRPNMYVLRTLWGVVDEQKAIRRFKDFISI